VPLLRQRRSAGSKRSFLATERRRESTGIARTRPKKAAQDVLKSREGRAADGRPLPPRLDRILYDELAEDVRRHYRTSEDRDTQEAEGRLRPLDACFTGRRAAEITTDETTKYVERRQAKGLANGTINRELAMLRHIFRFASEQDPPKVVRVPVIRLLKEAAPRAGFFEREQYEAVRRRLRPDLQVAVAIAYTFGWRMRDEVLTLERRHVDLGTGTIRLDPGSTKNDEDRVVYLTPALNVALAEQLDRVRALERKLGRIVPFVFAHAADGPLNPKTGLRRYQAGDRIRDFRRAWRTASKRAGVPGMLRHDFRRTALRNLVNDGTPEKVAMLITGHKTRSVFDRYHIVSPEDLKAATARIVQRDSHRNSHNSAPAAEMVSRK